MIRTNPLVERQLLDRYVAEVNRHSLLTRKEENDLAEDYQQTADPTLAHRLVVANLRFVVKVAHEFRGYGVALLDLIQEGNVGLMLAVKKFDPSRGYRLISYAVWWIKAYMQSFIMRTYSMVKIGTTVAQRKLFFKLRSERSRAERDQVTNDGTTKPVSAEQLAVTLGVSTRDVNDMDLRLAARDFSLDAKVREDTQRSHLESLQTETTDPETEVVEAEQRQIWAKRIARVAADFNERERYIFAARLRTDEPQTLRQIGERFKISRERVRQIQENIVAKLRFELSEREAEPMMA